MATVLLTGFEVFAHYPMNPSWEIAEALATKRQDTTALKLPCVFGAADLSTVLAETDAEVVIGLGLASQRPDITPERIAINVADAPIRDNAGAQPMNTALFNDGPAAYFSTLPIHAFTAALTDLQIPASISNTAGTYVCNAVFYEIMHLAAKTPSASANKPAPTCGFIHVPNLPSMGDPSIPLTTQIKAIDRAIDVSVNHHRHALAQTHAGLGAVH